MVFLGQDPPDHVALTAALLTCLMEVATQLLQILFLPLSGSFSLTFSLMNQIAQDEVSFLLISSLLEMCSSLASG